MNTITYSPNIALNVRNSDAAISFYSDVLDFKLVNTKAGTCGSEAEMKKGPITFWIDSCTAEQEHMVGHTFFDFRTDDLVQTIKTLEFKGCKIGSVTDTPNFIGRMVTDPYGMKFHIYQTLKKSSPVESLAFTVIYAEDLNRSVEFYKTYFGFVVDENNKMGPREVYGNMGTVGLWIGGGYKKSTSAESSVRATVMIKVFSANKLFQQLRADSIKLFQESPIKMKDNVYWFQLADVDGNVLDILGNE